mmetsp:Transcript_30495/g.71140  ORF Transcript_30495/g.71140 Transcript_30495/m.71140 type:complete len:716 (-) Transcript_30495:89-2236(-)|eukprot:CAMPEP_0178401620 /NCGR_PEP_ID=MMETSP0689_2-20121128/16398_1 /TAXON_ID=160604 /ORGANISM="Amphidinium massartii, Strain CS-259" /LENGTH=715 /DNA_ID=CAMNT_0020022451 /DNA_START=23 /DNA_END=2170 /DNA_ORIENTATION=-
MKLAVALLLSAAGIAAAAKHAETPVTRVVALLEQMKMKVEAVGDLEQKSYDKYACWCESTLGRKASDIATGKETIASLSTKSEELHGQLGALASEIENAKKLIEANLASQKEAQELRDGEHQQYQDEKTEAEQCIGALETAIKVLTGAGTGKSGFLEVPKETELLSVAADLRSILSKPRAMHSLKDRDLSILRSFVQKPEAFAHRASDSAGLLQDSQIVNPFGDYAPQSTVIQGVLKGMYDSFTSDLEKANVEEADQQKAFSELMATKKKELKTLQVTLEASELSEAEKTEELSETKTSRKEAQEQLEADETFFEDTKANCKQKAQDWNERENLRTQELQGINKAVAILSAPESERIFEAAHASFVQIKSTRNRNPAGARRSGAFAQLRALASRFQSTNLASMAVEVKNGGHFDKIIVMINEMMEVLRKEEQDDIAHRDRCQGAENKNSNNMEDLNHEIKKADNALDRLGGVQETLNGDIADLKMAMNMTAENQAELLNMRNEEAAEFKQTILDDTQAIELIEQAIVALSKFYESNGIPLELRQVRLHSQEEPLYFDDPDKAPRTEWEGPNYGGRKSETTGIVAILSMIKEDLQKEIATARKEDAEAEALYEKGMGSLRETMKAQKTSLTETNKELAEVEMKMADITEEKGQAGADLASEQTLNSAIYKDCSWVATHFESRRKKRQAEMQGLQEAKSYLARGEGDVPFEMYEETP